MTALEQFERYGGDIAIVSRRLRDTIVIEVSGEVDLATAPAVEQELLRAEQADEQVALDLSNTSFMDSTGLQMIIAVDKRLRERGRRLVVVQGPPQIRRLLDLTRVADHLEVICDKGELERTIAAHP
jgi:anti-sigma B factor antagonist